MRTVSQQSEEEVARQRAIDELRWPMKELAANILRIVRGAGKPYEIGPQMVAVLERMDSYRDRVGYYPSSHEIGEIINIRTINDGLPFDGMSLAVDIVVQGALQKAASQLVHQRTQEAAGQSEMFEGFYQIEAIRRENSRQPPRFTEREGRAQVTQETADRARKPSNRRAKKATPARD